MARKLKTYQTSVGFFDLAVAAPSMKAALQAWGADRNLFHDGMAKESDDPDVVAATMASPGVVLRRPVGSNRKHQPRAIAPAAARKAARAVEREEQRRERERAQQEAARQKARERRQRAVAKAQAALDAARERHEKNAAAIEAEREAVEKRSQAEEARWAKERVRLEAALREADE